MFEKEEVRAAKAEQLVEYWSRMSVGEQVAHGKIEAIIKEKYQSPNYYGIITKANDGTGGAVIKITITEHVTIFSNLLMIMARFLFSPR